MGSFYRMIHDPARNDSGFTLIEIIAVLIILSITAALAGAFMGQALDTFLFNRQAAALVQNTDSCLLQLTSQLQRSVKTPYYYDDDTLKITLKGDGLTNIVSYQYWKLEENVGIFGSYFCSNDRYSRLSGVGEYGTDEKLVTYHTYEGNAITLVGYYDFFIDCYITDLAAFDILLIMKNPSGSGEDIRFTTIVANRNNQLPNIPIAR